MLNRRLRAAQSLRESLQASLAEHGFLVHDALTFRGGGVGDEVCVVATAPIAAAQCSSGCPTARS